MEKATYENSQVEGGLRNWLKLRKAGRFLRELSEVANPPQENLIQSVGSLTLKAAEVH